LASSIIERPAELRAVHALLQSAASRPRGLVIEGEAGVGKTTLWLAGVAEARDRGFRILSARCGQAEAALAYAAVADLLHEVEPAVLAGLPEVQRVALNRVLLRAGGEGPPIDQGVVAATLASVIELLAAESPVLVALDDEQWLDPSSRAVMASAARRVTGPVGVLLTERTEHKDGGATDWLQMPGPEDVHRVVVGPMSLGGLHALVSARLGRSFPRPTMVRIGEISGGNPFYALELARAIKSGVSESVLPATLAELTRQRFGRLEGQTRSLLLAAACAAAPTTDLLARVSGDTVEHTVELLSEAEARGIIAVDGEDVRFTHTLLARSVYTEATRRERRAMHRLLAEAVVNPELRARHMALAATSTDPTALEALDVAADAARTRGALPAAAELVELAIGLGGDTPERRIRAAGYHLRAGNLEQARLLLDGLIDRLQPGVDCAMAQILLAQNRIHHNRFAEAVSLLEHALDNAEDNRELRVRTLLWLSYARFNAGDFLPALESAEDAVESAQDVCDPDLTSQVLAVRTCVKFVCGHGVDTSSMRRALDFENPNSDAPFAFRASATNALLLGWTGQLDEACERLAEVRRHCLERGAETDLVFVAVHTALTEISRGNYSEARHAAEDMTERAEQLGGEHVRLIALTVECALAAHAGREQEARSTATAAIELAHRCGAPQLADRALVSLGFLEVSLGRHEQALEILKPLLDRAAVNPGTEIVTAGYIPDAVEAMIALGRASDAEPLIEALEASGRKVDRPWMLAIGARCRSLWLAAGGDVAAAVETAELAMIHHDRLPMPFERARTLLVLGRLRRRNRKKDSARAALVEALDVFDALGTDLWAERARAEVDRGSVAPSNKELGLTPSEHRVAALAASGMTTREIADALFISPKTVGTNFARIYRKLGINSRAELGRLIGEGS
jgi:DNA-binding CsgD family transcriptional regulator